MTSLKACTDEEIGDGPSPLPNNSCLADQRNLPSPDVSRRLPDELLASVFIRIARDSYIDEEYCYSNPTPPSWINVSYVCHYWRDVALNCATLWSYIPATSQRWTEELLARSQMAPLKLSSRVISKFYNLYKVKRARLLSMVEEEMNHSQRIQELHLYFGNIANEDGYQVLSKFLFSRLPCLQHLEISHFDLPEDKSWLLFKEITPALRTLRLKECSLPWYSLGPSILTTLHLSDVGFHENTMAGFLAMLRRMPHLVQLSVENSLPSARRFLSSGEFNAAPRIGLPHLSNLSIRMAPLSAAALLSCIDIPLMTDVDMVVTSEDVTLDDYIRLASLLAQRISQSDSPKYRSLIISSLGSITLAFSTSARVPVSGYSAASRFSTRPDDSPLKVFFVYPDLHTEGLYHPVLCGICSAIPLTNIQSVCFFDMAIPPEFWEDMLGSLSDVRHIRFSGQKMPNITSILSFPSYYLTRSWQDGCADRGQCKIFVPALEELELYKTTLKRVPDPDVADVQALYDAIATRKETRCQLTIKKCRLETEGVTKAWESVGWWEGDQFTVTSND